jgi:sigma-54-specific transcriptional regulator
LLADKPEQLFQHVEGTLVRLAFERCRENQVHTARLLGITRNSLRTLLKRHGLLDDAPGGTVDFPTPELSEIQQPQALNC